MTLPKCHHCKGAGESRNGQDVLECVACSGTGWDLEKMKKVYELSASFVENEEAYYANTKQLEKERPRSGDWDADREFRKKKEETTKPIAEKKRLALEFLRMELFGWKPRHQQRLERLGGRT